MKIAYVTTYNAADIKNWSGTGYYMAKSLREQSILLEYVGPLKEKYSFNEYQSRLNWSVAGQTVKKNYYKA